MTEWHASEQYDLEDYYEKSDGAAHWRSGALKYGDAVCSICYAMGIDSFEEAQRIFNFIGEGVEPPPFIPNRAREQMNLIVKNKTRNPKHVLEIGAGRGEVSVAFSSFLNIKTTSLEPNRNFLTLLDRTAKYFGVGGVSENKNLKIVNKDVANSVDDIEWDTVDTVIFVESLEHILEKDFNKIYPKIRDSLKKSKGRLIITNWLRYHPIQIGQHAPPDMHCRVTDDKLYDSFAEESHRTVYRNCSHLVLEY